MNINCAFGSYACSIIYLQRASKQASTAKDLYSRLKALLQLGEMDWLKTWIATNLHSINSFFRNKFSKERVTNIDNFFLSKSINALGLYLYAQLIHSRDVFPLYQLQFCNKIF